MFGKTQNNKKKNLFFILFLMIFGLSFFVRQSGAVTGEKTLFFSANDLGRYGTDPGVVINWISLNVSEQRIDDEYEYMMDSYFLMEVDFAIFNQTSFNFTFYIRWHWGTTISIKLDPILQVLNTSDIQEFDISWELESPESLKWFDCGFIYPDGGHSIYYSTQNKKDNSIIYLDVDNIHDFSYNYRIFYDTLLSEFELHVLWPNTSISSAFLGIRSVYKDNFSRDSLLGEDWKLRIGFGFLNFSEDGWGTGSYIYRDTIILNETEVDYFDHYTEFLCTDEENNSHYNNEPNDSYQLPSANFRLGMRYSLYFQEEHIFSPSHSIFPQLKPTSSLQVNVWVTIVISIGTFGLGGFLTALYSKFKPFK